MHTTVLERSPFTLPRTAQRSQTIRLPNCHLTPFPVVYTVYHWSNSYTYTSFLNVITYTTRRYSRLATGYPVLHTTERKQSYDRLYRIIYIYIAASDSLGLEDDWNVRWLIWRLNGSSYAWILNIVFIFISILKETHWGGIFHIHVEEGMIYDQLYTGRQPVFIAKKNNPDGLKALSIFQWALQRFLCGNVNT